MGLGKTYVGSEKMRELGYPTNIIVCQKSKIDDWTEHMRQYGNVKVIDLTDGNGLALFRELHFFRAKGDPILVGVINYELLWRRMSQFENLHDYCLTLDESSLIQNPRAKQTKGILKLKPDATILLSGTPTSGKYENLWSQAHLLGWNISEKLYQSTYVNWETIDMGGVPIRRVRKDHPYKNVERLKSKLREHGAVFMKSEDVLDMPKQTFTVVKVDAPGAYADFRRDGIVMLDGETIVGDTMLTKRLRMRQLCGQYCDAKLAAFRDLLESTSDRVIVFYNFTTELERLKAVCDGLKRPVSVVNGMEKNLGAYEGCGDSVTLCQYQAGALGLNLQKANKMVYFTLPERSDLFEQSKKRIHRIGQERPCFYWILECRGTIEPAIRSALERRRDFTDELFREAM